MKKFRNIFLAFAAISALSLAFVSCSDSDDDDSTSDTTKTTKVGITAVTYTVADDGAGSMSDTSGTNNAGLTIYTSSVGDITIKTASGSKPKLSESKYVQFNTSSSAEFDALVITVSAACKATFTVNAAGNDTGKVYSLNGTALTKESSYYTQEVSLVAGDNIIKGSGFKFSKIAFE